MERAIEGLPAELREVVLLRETEEMSYEQIAGIVGCPLGTVKSRLNAARRRLRAVALDRIWPARESRQGSRFCGASCCSGGRTAVPRTGIRISGPALMACLQRSRSLICSPIWRAIRWRCG